MIRLAALEVGAVLWAASVLAAGGGATTTALQQAIAGCKVEATRRLLEGGADPNALDARQTPIIGWLAAGMKCSDADALEIARLLESHGATFEAPRLLTNLAPRHLPRTLAFLTGKHGAGNPTEALHAVARGEDLESIRALLEAGADPTDGVAKSSSLLDAAMAGHPDPVAEMLKHVPEKQSPKVLAAYGAAAQRKDEAVMRAFTAAGFIPPVVSAATPSCQPQELAPNDRALLTRLGLHNANRLAGLAGAMSCKRIQECGDLLLIDCNSAADGPAYYIDRKTETVLATCGGACMRGCTGCPPKEWTCGCAR